MSEAGFPTVSGVERALATIRPHVAETPLVRAELLSRALAADVWLKNETVTEIASFKLRGALNDLLAARKRGELRAVAAHSSGNHGRAVAYGARLLGIPAHAFISDKVSATKARAIEAYGGIIHRAGADIDHARFAAIDFAKANGFHFVYDGESLDMMEGAGTMALEIARRLADIDALIVPMGGGNLSAGSAAVMAALQPGARVIGVQPEVAPVIATSFRERRLVEVPPGESVADGLVGRVPVEFTMRVLWRYLADAWLVDERAIMSGARTLLECAHVLVEPSGAAALAAAWLRRRELAGKRIVLVLTSSN
ncbi:MAG: threonine ammonia-lyase, partial [Alphaproteobacteria bacterium]